MVLEYLPTMNGLLGGGFKYFFFTPVWGRFPIWLIFFRWVETTNQFKLMVNVDIPSMEHVLGKNHRALATRAARLCVRLYIFGCFFFKNLSQCTDRLKRLLYFDYTSIITLIYCNHSTCSISINSPSPKKYWVNRVVHGTLKHQSEGWLEEMQYLFLVAIIESLRFQCVKTVLHCLQGGPLVK